MPASSQAQQDEPEHVYRFDPVEHEYFIDGEQVLSITQMLDNCCYIDDSFYTEECAERGTRVHRLTADYDMGAIEQPASVEDKWKGYLLAYVGAMRSMGKPDWTAIEEALYSLVYRYGGRPDRVGKVWGAVSVLDIKTGGTYDWHGIQTALQAILAAQEHRLPPTAIVRYGLNLKANGKFKLLEHKNVRDFDRAYEVIRRSTKA